MEQLEKRIIELAGNGLYCSQIMVALSQDMHGVQNDHLIRALSGLNRGMYCKKTCGTLSGGTCLLSLYTGGDAQTPPKDCHVQIVRDFVNWFETEFQESDCERLLIGHEKDQPQFCSNLIVQSFIQCMQLLSQNDIDPDLL